MDHEKSDVFYPVEDELSKSTAKILVPKISQGFNTICEGKKDLENPNDRWYFSLNQQDLHHSQWLNTQLLAKKKTGYPGNWPWWAIMSTFFRQTFASNVEENRKLPPPILFCTRTEGRPDPVLWVKPTKMLKKVTFWGWMTRNEGVACFSPKNFCWQSCRESKVTPDPMFSALDRGRPDPVPYAKSSKNAWKNGFLGSISQNEGVAHFFPRNVCWQSCRESKVTPNLIFFSLDRGCPDPVP